MRQFSARLASAFEVSVHSRTGDAGRLPSGEVSSIPMLRDCVLLFVFESGLVLYIWLGSWVWVFYNFSRCIVIVIERWIEMPCIVLTGISQTVLALGLCSDLVMSLFS